MNTQITRWFVSPCSTSTFTLPIQILAHSFIAGSRAQGPIHHMRQFFSGGNLFTIQNVKSGQYATLDGPADLVCTHLHAYRALLTNFTRTSRSLVVLLPRCGRSMLLGIITTPMLCLFFLTNSRIFRDQLTFTLFLVSGSLTPVSCGPWPLMPLQQMFVLPFLTPISTFVSHRETGYPRQIG